MKITCLLILVALVQVSASSYSQSTKLTLKLKNASLSELFEEIEEMSEFRFFYDSSEIDLSKKISIKKVDSKIDEVLVEAFNETEYAYEIIDRHIIVRNLGETNRVGDNSGKQQTSISGTVTDADGEPLPGVTVLIKGTNNGTVTNVDGTYQIVVPADGILVFSFIGMEIQEIAVGNQTRINVTMVSDVEDIDEIVVIGYGTQKKSHLTAAIDQIGGEVLENRPLRSLGDGLQGMVAGLNINAPSGAPESGLHFNIRGFTGFGSSAQPLILVDGIERNVNDVNPNDVASVSVLKDGAASAIYGSRAPFGVVLITTKSGKKGEKLKIRYSGNFRFGKPWGTPESLDSYVWAGYMNEGRRNTPGGGKVGYFSDIQVQRMEALANGDFSNPVFDGIDPAAVPYGTFEISPTQWGGHWSAFGNTDWLDLALKDVVPSQTHDVSVSGGSDKTSYYAGLGYNESVGIFEGPNYKNRYSALMKFDTEITDWFSFNLSANYVKTDEEGPNFFGQGRNYGLIWNVFARSFPSWPTTNPNGTYYRFNSMTNMNGEGGTEGINRNDLTLTGGVIFEPIKDLKITGNYTWRNNTRSSDVSSIQLKQVLPNGDLVPTSRTVGFESIKKSFSNTDYHNVDLHASYSKTLNDKHNLYGLIGYQEEANMYSYLEGKATNFYSTSIRTLSTSADGYETSDRLYDWATMGVFGRFSYNYDEKYFIEFNFRRDATSRFRKEDRWATFPSVSGAWNVARENFWPLAEQISLFKIRGSWSTSGNANIGAYYPFYPTLNTGISSSIILDGEFVSYATMPGLVSSKLTWAKPTTIDIGLDMNALKNRLEINYDWFQRTVHDQFGPAQPLPETLGASVPQSNNAVSETRGWEVKVNWKDKAFNILGKPLRYSVGFRMSDHIGYVVEYEDNGTGSVGGGQWTKGEVFGQNYQYVSNGIMTSVNDLYNNVPQGGTWYYPGDLAMKDLNGDGEINTGTTGTWYSRGDLVKNGFNYPRKRYGISLSAEWNNFDISVQLDGVGQWTRYTNNKFVWGTQGSIWHTTYYQEHLDLGYWRPDNTDAFYPRNTLSYKNTNRANDQYTLDLSHLRIRNLKFGYNLPKTLVNKIKLDKVYLYASAENLGFIYYKSFIKYDPELIAASSGEGYPPQQFMSFGINVEF